MQHKRFQFIKRFFNLSICLSIFMQLVSGTTVAAAAPEIESKLSDTVRSSKAIPSLSQFTSDKDISGLVSKGVYADPRYTPASDPTLTWNTFLGGSGSDGAYSVVVDDSGNVYVTGSVTQDAFVAKLDSSGATIWSIPLGGSGDGGNAIAVDGSGNVYVAGYSSSTWGNPLRPYSSSSMDAFAAKISPTGSLVWNTFLGGSGYDQGYAITVDADGNVYAVGNSDATWGTPIRAYVPYTAPNTYGGDTFIAKLSSTGDLAWNTFLGGTGSDNCYTNCVFVDSGGNIYISAMSDATWGAPLSPYSTYNDAFVAKLNSSGALAWHTFLGAAGDDYGTGIAVDGGGYIYLAGISSNTWGNPLRAYTSGQDGFTAKLNPSGGLVWNTFLGGTGGIDDIFSLVLDSSGNMYLAGISTASWGTPVRAFTPGTSPEPDMSSADAFAVKLDSSGALIWNTFLGGNNRDEGNAIAVDSNGNVYVAGNSYAGWGAPIQAYYGSGTDAFVAKIAGGGGGIPEPDITAPIVNTFAATTPSNSLNIPITDFTASDSTGVTDYMITTSSTQPLANNPSWSGTVPTTYSVNSAGTYTLYPWAKDAAGNISTVFGNPRTVTVDTTAPTVNTFTVTTPSSTINIPITSFTASDTNGVAGYIITTTPTPPLSGASGWTSIAPTTYKIINTGIYTLYPWAKDAAGNVSAVFNSPVSATVSCPSPVIVTSSADSGIGTLREALANSCSGSVITFAPALAGETIRLASTLTLDKDVTIDGTGLDPQVTISGDTDGNGTGNVRVFYVNSEITVNLNGLIVTKGYAASDNGGGTYNSGGMLTITDSVFSSNDVSSGSGGGIYNSSGIVTVINSSFSGNSASYNGGGIYNSSGTVTVTNSAFSGNSATSGSGGGIYVSYNGTPMDISNSTFSDNTARSNGGGIYYYINFYYSLQSTLAVTNSTFSNNSVSSGSGGGIYANGDGIVYVSNSTFSNNSASSDGGGIYRYGHLTMANSTFSGNSAIGNGGGVRNQGTLTLKNNTFSGNSASGNGSGIYHHYGTLNYANTILANSIIGYDCYKYSGTIGTNANNLIENNAPPLYSCGTPALTSDPNLGALADNGGPTQTLALLYGSPAIDGGNDAVCAAAPVNGEDQRGVARPYGAHCDIGAFEAGPLGEPALAITASPETYEQIGEIVTYTYTITNIGAADLNGPFTVTNEAGSTVAITCPASPNVLAPNDTFTCTGTYQITQADLDNGSLTITASSTPAGAATVDTAKITAVQNGALSLTKAPSTLATTTSVTYTYTLTNTGNVTLSSYAITDDKLGAICQGGSHSNPDNAGSPILPMQIAPGATITCTKAHTITSAEIADRSLVNIATATASYNKYDASSGIKTLTTVEANASAMVVTTPIYLNIAAVLNTGSAPYTNQQITYTFSIHNVSTGSVTMSDIAVTGFTGHGAQPVISCPGVIAAGATLTCPSASYNVVQSDLDAATTGTGDPIVLTATATATSGVTYSAATTESVDLYRVERLQLKTDTTVTIAGVPSTTVKTLDGIPNVTIAVTPISGSVVTYTYTITNTGNVTLSAPVGGFVVTDTQITNDITCATPTAAIAPGETKVCTSTREILLEDVNNGSVIGVTETSGMFGINTYTDTGKSMTLTSTTPRLTLEITTPVSSVVGAGVPIVYSYILTNTGNADLSTLADSTPYDFATGSLKGTTPTCNKTVLAIGESTTCTGTYTTTSADKGFDVTNTTSAYAYTADNTQVHSNTATVVVAVTAPTYCNVSHGPLTVETINSIPTFGMTLSNNNEYSVDVSSITIIYNDVPTMQQVTELTLGAGNVLWSNLNQSMNGSYAFTLETFTGNHTLAPEASNVQFYVSGWKTGYTPNGSEHILIKFTDASCADLDSGVPSVTPTADLKITKTDGVDSVDTNGMTTYTIRVSNESGDNITNAKLADPVASGIAKQAGGITCSSTPGVCVTPPTKTQLESGSFIVPTLAAGQWYEIKVLAKITATAGTTVTNIATVTMPLGTVDPTPANNSATDIDTASNPSADFTLTKSNGAGSISSGTNTTYTIRVTNNGPSTISGAKLTDTAATGLTKISISCGASGQCVTPPTVAQLESGTYALPTLAPGQFYDIQVIANVTAASGNVSNSATVTMPIDASDPIPGNNSASDTDNVISPIADLSITKTDGVTSVIAGSSTTYTIVVTNNGPSPANNALFKDAAATGLNVTSVTCGSSTGGATCPTVSNTTKALMQGTGIIIPTLPAGGSVTFTVTATVTATSGSIVNAAIITAPAGVTDPVSSNNSATDTDIVTSTADLSITKTDGFPSIYTGGSTIYTIRVTNAGPAAVTGAVLTDVAATGLSKTSVSCSGAPGQCVTAPTVAQLQSGTFALPTLASGQFYEIAVSTNVTATSGSVSNSATVAVPSGTIDPTSGNNSATDTDTVTPVADLSITKTDSVTSVNAGGTATYTIMVANSGPSSANNAVFKDPAIAGLTVSTVTCGSATGGAACPTAGNTTVASMQGSGIVIPVLPEGGTLTFTVTGTVSAANGTLVNVATITVPDGTVDPASGNNSDTDTDTVTSIADLSITKTDGLGVVNTGTSTTYTIRVTNDGSSSVSGAILTDAAVTGLSKISVACSSTSGQCISAPTVTQLQSGIALPTLAPAQFYEINVVTNVTASSGSVSNTATVAPPSGAIDPNLSDNSTTDIDTVVAIADLSITKTDNLTNVETGAATTYTIVVANNGPSPANGAVFRDPAAAGLNVTSVVCGSATGGATCPTAGNTTVSLMQGSGIIIPTLPSGSNLAFTVNSMVTATGGTLVNTATITAPAGVTDPSQANNTATDTDALACTPGGLSISPIKISGNQATFIVTNNMGVSLPIDAVITSWANAGAGAANYQLNSVALNNTSMLTTPGMPASSSPYISGTGILKSGATTFTFIFSKNNPANMAADFSFQTPYNIAACNRSTTLPTYTIAGNAGMAGATITYTDGATTADSNGNYSFTVPNGWSGTVTPSLTGYAFSPANRSYTDLASNLTGENYVATETTPPTVISALRANANPTGAASVNFTVTFSEPVTGVDASDFYLPSSGVSGASVTNVSGSGSTYTVTVNTGSGSGTLQLGVGDNDTIMDAAGNPLGGVGINNGKYLGQKYTIDKAFPTVSSLVRASANPTSAATVQYTLTFSRTVTGVDPSDFTLAQTGVTGSSVASVTGSGVTYTVTVNTGSGSGMLGLNLSDNNSIKDAVGNALGGVGMGDGDYTGEVYNVNVVDSTFPTVASSLRADADFTYASSVHFTVTFSKSVTGVDAADFSLASSVIGASITNVTGSGTTYTVTVNTGSGNGTLRLVVQDNDTIIDSAGNPLGGVGLNNGKYALGQYYSIYKSTPSVTSLVRASGNPTNAATVQYTLTFSESVKGVNAPDFSFTLTSGTTGASVVSVSGSGKIYTITVNTGTGNGTLRLNVIDNDSITGLSGIPLGGTGDNGLYTGGEVYTISK